MGVYDTQENPSGEGRVLEGGPYPGVYYLEHMPGTMTLPVQKCSPEATNTDLTQETLKSKTYCDSQGFSTRYVRRTLSVRSSTPSPMLIVHSLSRSPFQPSTPIRQTNAVGTNAAGIDAADRGLCV